MKQILIRRTLIIAASTTLILFMQKEGISQTFINPDGLGKSSSYSQVVVSGGTTYISGQVSVNEKGEVVGKGDLRAQTMQALENLRLCLTAAGLEFKDVVKMTTYVVNLKPADIPIIREVRMKYLNAEGPPASTLVGVQSLVGPDWMIEIEAIAAKKKN